ncbi:ArdC-like ssDNA-binding domain-containing protein [Nocardia yamanashiensis]|uniref:ArdC-like ssDNA-binding domain-containing protein n=1 Tax=Nocardia yamanashiensis TaxID=209247 RepID=UPI0008352CED|nr:ArdC-like ssDNA-binding domain-containing protein [Nocardia yamanashiensis]
MGKRRTYSEAERAERDAADAAIRDQADALLSDPAAVAALISKLSRCTAPKMLRYSLRNCAMLEKQGQERGMDVTDVENFRGWQMRGRSIRKGERALRIVAPRGTEEVKNDNNAEPAPTDSAAEGETQTKTRFRMAPVFDISQTDGIENFDGEPVTVEPVADPAAALAASLVEQLERYGYQVTPGAGAEIDHEARTITTGPGGQAEQLAQALAVVLTLPPAERPRQQPAPRAATPARQAPTAPADPSRILLELGKYADAHATIRTDYTTGRTFYTVTGPRASGTFTIVSQNPTESDTVQRFSVEYGEGNRPHSFDRYHRRDRPVINGIDLVGGSAGFTVDRIDDIDGTRLHCRRSLGPTHDEDAPPRTKERAAAIVRAILRHYMTRDDLHALHRAAAAVEAPYRRAEQNRAAANLADRIAQLEAEHAEHTAKARRYDAIAADTEQLTLI